MLKYRLIRRSFKYKEFLKVLIYSILQKEMIFKKS